MRSFAFVFVLGLLAVSVSAQDPTGACCTPLGCTELTSADCGGNDQVYFGDGTTCVEGSCPGTIGACCGRNDLSSLFGAGNVFQKFCSQQTPDDCFSSNGVYQGDGEVCPEASLVNDNSLQSSSCGCCQAGELLVKLVRISNGNEFTACVREGFVDDNANFEFHQPVCPLGEGPCAFVLSTPVQPIIETGGYDETCLFNKGEACGQPVQDCAAFPDYGACCTQTPGGFLTPPEIVPECEYTTSAQCDAIGGLYSGDGSVCPYSSFDITVDETTVVAQTTNCPCCPEGYSYGLIETNGATLDVCLDDTAKAEDNPDVNMFVFVCDDAGCSAVQVTGDVGDVGGKQASCGLNVGGSCGDEPSFVCPAPAPTAHEACCKCDAESGAMSTDFWITAPTTQDCNDRCFECNNMEQSASEMISGMFLPNDNCEITQADACVSLTPPPTPPPLVQNQCCRCRSKNMEGEADTNFAVAAMGTTCDVACSSPDPGCELSGVVLAFDLGTTMEPTGCSTTNCAPDFPNDPSGACCIKYEIPFLGLTNGEVLETDCFPISQELCEAANAVPGQTATYNGDGSLCQTLGTGQTMSSSRGCACCPEDFVATFFIFDGDTDESRVFCIQEGVTLPQTNNVLIAVPTCNDGDCALQAYNLESDSVVFEPSNACQNCIFNDIDTCAVGMNCANQNCFSPNPEPTPAPPPGVCDPDLEIVCNAALSGDCNVAGGKNLGDRLADLSGRLEQLENAQP